MFSQAIKEEKMEVTLSQLAERWNNVVWGMDPYKGGDVPLLKIAEEDFEALEVLVSGTTVQRSQYFMCLRNAVHCTANTGRIQYLRYIYAHSSTLTQASHRAPGNHASSALDIDCLAARTVAATYILLFPGGPACGTGHDGLQIPCAV